MNDSGNPPRPRGVLLRDLIVLALDRAPTRTLDRGEIETAIRGAGFALPPGRPGKAISDAVTTEVRRNRARRPARGLVTLVRPLTASERQRSTARVWRARNGRGRPVHLVATSWTGTEDALRGDKTPGPR